MKHSVVTELSFISFPFDSFLSALCEEVSALQLHRYEFQILKSTLYKPKIFLGVLICLVKKYFFVVVITSLPKR